MNGAPRPEARRRCQVAQQGERRVEVYRRHGTSWTYEAGSEGTVLLSSVDAEVALEALYHDPLA